MIMERKQYAYVIVGYLHVDLDLVKVINIEENLFGEDVVTFEWDGMVRQSRIYIKENE
jgi:hypothetical protein